MTAPLEPKMPEPDVSYEAARDDRDLRYAYSEEAMQAYGDARARHAAEVAVEALLALRNASGGSFTGWHPNYAEAIEKIEAALAIVPNIRHLLKIDEASAAIRATEATKEEAALQRLTRISEDMGLYDDPKTGSKKP